MTKNSEWLRCKELSRAELRRSGGCLWSVKPNSPGNSLKIPSGTAFRVKYEGPESHVYVKGTIEQAAFNVQQSSASGSYSSASAAVNAVRSHVESTNAYLYIEFLVGSTWRLSDDLRYDPTISIPLDPVEEKVYESFREVVRKKFRGIPLEEVYAKSEILFDENPDLVVKVAENWKPVFYPDDEET
jgi:hypothetical protein